MPKLIAVAPGDGIGPEQWEAIKPIVEKVKEKFNLDFEIKEVLFADTALEKLGDPVPKESVEVVEKAVALLKGPFGETAGKAVLFLRRHFELFANLRPFESLPNVPSPIKGVDKLRFSVVRENLEDVYIQDEELVEDPEKGKVGIAKKLISEKETERVAKFALDYAKARGWRKAYIITKKNVLKKVDGLFYEVAKRVLEKELEVIHEYVDATSFYLVTQPWRYNESVIVTPNQYGDILTDEMSGVVYYSLGPGVSANIGENFAMFEPVHGAAFDIAGQNKADPTSLTMAFAQLLDWIGNKFGEENYKKAAEAIEKAVKETYSNFEFPIYYENFFEKIKDFEPLAREALEKGKFFGTKEFAERVNSRI